MTNSLSITLGFIITLPLCFQWSDKNTVQRCNRCNSTPCLLARLRIHSAKFEVSKDKDKEVKARKKAKELIHQLENPTSISEKVNIIQQLAQYKFPFVADKIIDLLCDPHQDPLILFEAEWALVKLEKTGKSRIAALLKTQNAPVHPLLVALTHIAQRYPEFLTSLVSHEHPKVAVIALKALAFSNSEEAEKVFYQSFTTISPLVWPEYVKIAAVTNPVSGKPIIRKALHIDDIDTKLSALEAIELGEMLTLLDTAAALMQSQNSLIAYRAFQVIKKLAPEKYITDIAAYFDNCGDDQCREESLLALGRVAKPQVAHFLRKVISQFGDKSRLGNLALRALRRTFGANPPPQRINNTLPYDLDLVRIGKNNHFVFLALFNFEGYRVIRTGILKIGCCNGRKKRIKVNRFSFNEKRELKVKLPCTLKPCFGACLDVEFIDSTGKRVFRRVDIDSFFTCSISAPPLLKYKWKQIILRADSFDRDITSWLL